ncbi:MAG TPA: gluconate 2-dehydrogenase subunit 3 family protein [Flavisolibacter sp.]
MHRREAVQYITLLLGGTLVGANSFLTGCKSESGEKKAFDQNDIAFLNEVGETILPTTATPGAKAANVGLFMTVMVNDCYDAKDQKAFKEGMGKLNDAAKKKFDADFMKLTAPQRHELLVGLDAEQKEFMKTKKEGEAAHYFRMMKELTLLGYFTSEIGSKQARRHVPVPGRYEGCIPYKKGDKAFA